STRVENWPARGRRTCGQEVAGSSTSGRDKQMAKKAIIKQKTKTKRAEQAAARAKEGRAAYKQARATPAAAPTAAVATDKPPRKRHFAAPPPVDLSARIVEAVLPAQTTAHERQLRRLMSLERVSLAEQAADIDQEDRAALEARAYCQELLKRDDDALHLLGSLIAVRQTYAVLYRELQQLLEREEAAGRAVPQLAEDYLIQCAMHRASQSFDEHELMQGFVDTVLPHVATIVDSHAQGDETAVREAMEQELKDRAKRLIPLGFLLDMDDQTPDFPRSQSLVLLGWENAVLFVLDRIVEAVLAARQDPTQIVRFRETAPVTTDDHPLLIDLSPEQ